MAEYFFELLAEEIPAWMHNAAAATLTERLGKLAMDLGGAGESCVCVNTTPRRIAFMIKDLALRESDREIEVKGPPKKSAYDADGKWEIRLPKGKPGDYMVMTALMPQIVAISNCPILFNACNNYKLKPLTLEILK